MSNGSAPLPEAPPSKRPRANSSDSLPGEDSRPPSVFSTSSEAPSSSSLPVSTFSSLPTLNFCPLNFSSLSSLFPDHSQNGYFLYFFSKRKPRHDPDETRAILRQIDDACSSLILLFNERFPDFKALSTSAASELSVVQFVAGSTFAAMEDFTSSLLSYTSAILLNPFFAECYLERGMLLGQFLTFTENSQLFEQELRHFTAWAPSKMFASFFEDGVDYFRDLLAAMKLYENKQHRGPERDFGLLNESKVDSRVATCQSFLMDMANRYVQTFDLLIKWARLADFQRKKLTEEFDGGGSAHIFLFRMLQEFKAQDVRQRSTESEYIATLRSRVAAVYSAIDFNPSLVPACVQTVLELHSAQAKALQLPLPTENRPFGELPATSLIKFPNILGALFPLETFRSAALTASLHRNFAEGEMFQEQAFTVGAIQIGAIASDMGMSAETQAALQAALISTAGSSVANTSGATSAPSSIMGTPASTSRDVLESVREFYEGSLEKSRARIRSLLTRREELIKHNALFQKASLCAQCIHKPRDTLFMPCRHLTHCAACAKSCTHCPTPDCGVKLEQIIESVRFS